MNFHVQRSDLVFEVIDSRKDLCGAKHDAQVSGWVAWG